MKLELRNLTCGYAPQLPIVKNVSLTVESGEALCILGPNGVGKTTLFRTILNLEKPLEGHIFIDAQDTAAWKPKRLARCVAYVAQAHVPVFPYTVKEMALMGRMGQLGLTGQPSRADHALAEQALETVGIRHLRNKRYTEISGGERQLLMIARALCQEPKLLIMDEPTANLDYGNMVLIMEQIRTLKAQGLAVIFTSHMPDQAFYTEAKTALLQRNGPVIFGTAEQVLTERNLAAAYHADIQILEVIGYDGHPIQVVAPRFHRNKEVENPWNREQTIC